MFLDVIGPGEAVGRALSDALPVIIPVAALVLIAAGVAVFLTVRSKKREKSEKNDKNKAE